MKTSIRKILFLSFIAVLAGCASPGPTFPDAGYVSLFNGHDLTGWQYKVGAPNVIGAFDGKAASSDARYTVADGVMTVHDRDRNPAANQPLRVLYTVQKFSGDFDLKLEFRAGVNADSGIYIGTKQLQCRDYLIAGPYYKLTQYKPQDWNQIEIVVHGNSAHCTCNGEVLEEAMPIPAGTRDIGLEADRGPTMEYRNIELKAL
ncbi:MAG TPA: DUF1080 domain-containing protein [Opitutales bacterium]|jgi:hypothetical protein|nr:DUF1080 domain-containing protein [Opitutales bacterium]